MYILFTIHNCIYNYVIFNLLYKILFIRSLGFFLTTVSDVTKLKTFRGIVDQLSTVDLRGLSCKLNSTRQN